MIPDEHGREDVMREAVSLTRRIECQYADRQDAVILGFNDVSWLFVYPGGDTMYRFDELGRLRRAFVDGRLYRTSGKSLAELTRHREPYESNGEAGTQQVLLRRELSIEALAVFQTRCLDLIEELANGLPAAAIARQYPEGMQDFIPAFEEGLRRVLDADLFLAPAIVRRK